MEQRRYEVGETIVYRNNGVCRVAENDAKMGGVGDKRRYYVLTPLNSQESKIFLPVDSEALVSQIRPVLTKEEIDALLSATVGDSVEWIDDKNQRNANFRDVMKLGIGEELILMIRCIYLKKKELGEVGRKLPTGAEDTQKAAEKLIREEFAYALDIPEDEVSGYIAAHLETKEA